MYKTIHVIPSGKSYTSYEKMINSLKPDEVINTEELQKVINKGNHVYVYISPCEAEIDNMSILRWGTSKEDIIINYYNNIESI